jgi:adenosylcobinamide kinase/adenosylcobinamide-phosphate guanylyltransferase
VSRVRLVTGGARSGKSRYALSLMDPYRTKAFIATAEALDDEMRDRIAKHRAERGGAFVTVEAPLELARAIRDLPDNVEAAIVDCLTVWLGNLVHHYGDDEPKLRAETDALLEVLRDPPVDIVLVTNELGMGIVPDNALARRFRDLAGWLNQDVARVAGQVALVVSGIAVTIKESPSEQA